MQVPTPSPALTCTGHRGQAGTTGHRGQAGTTVPGGSCRWRSKGCTSLLRGISPDLAPGCPGLAEERIESSMGWSVRVVEVIVLM